MKKGYTLIELICCIGLLLLVISLTSKNLEGIKRLIKNEEFKVNSTRLLHDLRFAKNYAENHGVSTSILISEKSYIIKVSTQVLKNIVLEKDIRFLSLANNNISFRANGVVSPYATSLIITDDIGNLSTITIKVGTFTIDYKRV